jgi:hypothetical protein
MMGSDMFATHSLFGRPWPINSAVESGNGNNFFQDGCQNSITICHVSGHTHFSLDTTTEFSQWQRPLSGVHFIMRVKSAQTDEGGVHAQHFSLYLPSSTKLWCTLQLRGQIHSPYFSPHMYSVVTTFKPVLKF